MSFLSGMFVDNKLDINLSTGSNSEVYLMDTEGMKPVCIVTNRTHFHTHLPNMLGGAVTLSW